MSKQMGISLIGLLPNEAEWEKAAKGPNGDEFITLATSEQAHFNAEATRVVNHPDAYANGFGLTDMIGNVWEWTSSPWDRGSTYFVLRSASFGSDDPAYLRAARRIMGHESDRSADYGYRPILVPQGS